MLPLLALAPLAIDLIGGIFGKKGSDKLAGDIRNQKITMPEEAIRAEELARMTSFMGMPGYETYKENINQMLPKTLSQVKELATSPSSIIDLAAKGLSASNDAYNQLAVKDTEARVGNIRSYQNVLQNKAGMALGIQNENNQIQLAGDYQEAQGTKDLMGSINQGVGNSISLYGDMEKNKYLKDQNAALSEFFKPHDTPTTTPTVASGGFTPNTPGPTSSTSSIDMNSMWQNAVTESQKPKNIGLTSNATLADLPSDQQEDPLYANFRNSILSKFGFIS